MDEKGREVRHISLDGFEIEKREEDGEVRLTALAHRTGVRTEIFDFTEEISPGAFRKAIPKSDIVLNVNHGRSSGVLARTTSGTMKVWESADGLMLRASLGFKDPEHVSLVSKLERGDLSELSFAFSLEGGKQIWTDDGDMPHRQIERVGMLFDVSIVERPAFPETGVVSMRDKELSRLAHMSRDLGPAITDLNRYRLYKRRLGL